MGKIENYKIDFIERTRDLLKYKFLDLKDNDREVTFLLNCLLGLIVNVSENSKKSNSAFRDMIDEEFLNNIPDKIGFIIKREHKCDLTNFDTTNFVTIVGHKEELKLHDKLWFINKLRNGIAHQNIEGINENEEWIGVRLWNIYNDVKDFEIIFTIDELRKFALKIAGEY